MCLSMIHLVKLVHLWFSRKQNITQYLVIMPGNNVPGNNVPGNNVPGNNVPGNNRKFCDEISHAHPVFKVSYNIEILKVI